VQAVQCKSVSNVSLAFLLLSFAPGIIFKQQAWILSDFVGAKTWISPFSLNSDKNEIFVYVITTYSNIQVMRIKEVITKDKMS